MKILLVIMAVLEGIVGLRIAGIMPGDRFGLQSIFIWQTIVLHSALALWGGSLIWLTTRRSEAKTTK